MGREEPSRKPDIMKATQDQCSACAVWSAVSEAGGTWLGSLCWEDWEQLQEPEGRENPAGSPTRWPTSWRPHRTSAGAVICLPVRLGGHGWAVCVQQRVLRGLGAAA